MPNHRMWVAALTLCALCLTVTSIAAEDSDAFYLKPADRVVFLGDSITFQKLYTKYIESFTTAFYGDLGCEFWNAGNNGDTAEGALKRLDADVLSHQPTVVTICFGMNDSRIWPKGHQRYKDALTELVKRCKAAGARVVLLTPPCVDEGHEFGNVERSNKPIGFNIHLWTFARKVFEVGKEQGVPVIDVFHPLLVALRKGQSRDRSFSLIPDLIHPNEQGHYVIAMTILEAWNWRTWDKTR